MAQSFIALYLPEEKKHIVLRACLLLLFSLYFLCVAPLSAQNINTDSLKQSLTEQKGVNKIKTLSNLASAYANTDNDSSVNYAIEALHLAYEINDSESIIASEYQLGILQARKKADSLALQHLRIGLDRALSINRSDLVCSGYLKLSEYYLIANTPRRSIEYANQAMAIAEKSNDKKQLADTYFRLGAAYRVLGSFQKSISHYLNALRLNDELNDRREISKISNSIGGVYLRTVDLEDALEYFNRALKISESLNDAQGIVSNMNSIGAVYQKKRNQEKALSYYTRALPITRALNDRLREAIVTGNIGSTLVDSGKFKEGLAYLYQALAIKEKVQNHQSTLHTLNDIALVKYKLGDAKGAREAAEKVVNMAKKYEVSDQLRYGYLTLSKSYRLAKDYENAYTFLRKYNAINDSLFGIEKAQQINELEIQYDTEKKDMAINALQQEKEIANARRKIYFLAGAIVLLVLAGLYFNQRLKTKRNQELLAKEREIDRLKTNFFANISHEFRTPLSLILGPVETMLDNASQPEQRFQLELMKKHASRLMRLINQILDLSKLQAGHLELKAKAINAVELIKGVSATFQSLTDSKGIRFTFKSAADEIMLYCDQEHIETICINLISNAFKFSEVGGEITVLMTKIDPLNSKHTEGELELQVADNGVGIPAEHLSQIFDRFYRAGSSSEKQYGGTGIGLALTRELVELHGGTIGVTSEPGKGTVVTVRIPLGKTHLRKEQIIEGEIELSENIYSEVHSLEYIQHDEASAEVTYTQKPIVLLIDDNEDVRSYIKSVLHTKYTLLESVNGEEGIRHAKTFMPDLIISDVMMPEMNGYEACKRLKKDETTSHIPVILLTAKASIDSRIQGLETEADLYLNKPFVPKELELCISNLIQSRKKLRERYNRQVVLKPTDIAINSTDELFLQRLMKVLEAQYEDENLSVEQLSTEIGMSRSQLHRKLQALTNESASQFIRSFRLQRAMELLKKKHASVSEIAYMVGFASHSYFNKCFSEQYGRTPSSVMEESVTHS